MWCAVNLDITEQLQHTSLHITEKALDKYYLMILDVLVLSHIYGIVLEVAFNGLHTTVVIMRMQVLTVPFNYFFMQESSDVELGRLFNIGIQGYN